jgi:aromatic ring-opening dioxygenase catalytic subunit (LigB family)
VTDIALAVAAAHAPGLTGWPDKAGEETWSEVKGAYERLGQSIRDAQLDALIVVANDHLANYGPADYPDFVVGVAAEHTGPAEWFKPWLSAPDYRLPGHPELARTIYESLRESSDLRIETSDELQFDDNLSVPTTMTGLQDIGVPVIPIIQNCTVPPVPDHRRSYEIGQQLAAALQKAPAGTRVGLFGSGGLSHEPGGPRYLEIDEEFDRWFLDLLAEGDHEKILRESTLERMEEAGAGGTAELFSWLVVLGAAGRRPATVLGYAAWDQWRCGIGAVSWDMDAAPAAAKA